MATLHILPVSVGTNKTAQVIVLSPPRQPVKILPKEQDQNASAVGGVLQTGLTPGGAVLREHTKKRIHFSKKALTHPRPQSVVKRNTRERNRIKAVNQSFLTLANHVPENMRSKKMSKVDTLKAAIKYINALQAALDSDSPLSIPDLSELNDFFPPESPASSSVANSDVTSCLTSPSGYQPITSSPITTTTHDKPHCSSYPPSTLNCQQLTYEPISPAAYNQQSASPVYHQPLSLTYNRSTSTSAQQYWSSPQQHMYYTSQNINSKYQQYSSSYSSTAPDVCYSTAAAVPQNQDIPSGSQSDGWMSPTDSHYSFSSTSSSDATSCYQFYN